MKNLRRAFAVVIALTMVLSTVAFAAVFTDVKDDAAYAEAIELGVALNLFKGYEDGSFKPEGDITRAEFAAIVVRTLGQEAQAEGAKGTTKFIDVPSTHWASGYVNIAANLGIVNGYGDGNFGPEDKVTYEQAVKMVVVALGYEPAVGSAGYPVGYLTIAQQRGVTNGVKGTNGVPANRGQVAQMVFNALDVPLLEQTGFGTYVDYLVQDGTGDSAYKKTLLTEKLGIVKLKAIAVSSYDLSSSKKADLVNVELLNVYKTKYDDEFEAGKNIDVAVGTTNLKSLVGFNVMLYVSYDDNSSDESVAVYVKKDISNSSELVVNSKDYEATTVAAGVATVAYWPTSTSRTTDKITIPNNATIYINGYKQANTATVSGTLGSNDFYGYATFALLNSKTATQDYDTLFVTNYKNSVVESVNTSTGRVVVKAGSPISFAVDNKDITSSLYDKDGKELDWKTLKENDLLSVRVVSEGSKKVYVATLVNNIVTGKITEVSADKFTIDGKEYEVDGQITATGDLSLEDEGTFYLDILGNIAYFDVTTGVSSNYAYIIASGSTGTIDSRAEIKMFTYKGEVVTLKTASKVSITKADGTKNSYTSTVTAGANNDVLDFIAKDDFVTFDVNSSGEISKIVFPQTKLGDTDTKVFSLYSTITGDTKASYKDSTQSIRVDGRRATITDKTAIFLAPLTSTTPDDDDYDLISLASLNDDYDNWKNVSVFDVNKNGEAGAILITDPDSVDLTSGGTNIAMVVKRSEGKNAEGDSIYKYTVLQDGEVKVLDAIDNIISMVQAQVVIPEINAKGQLKGFKAIASIDAVGNKVNAGADIDTIDGTDGNDVFYTLGEATDITSNKITIGDEEYAIPSSANVYVYDEGASTNNKVTISDLDFINVFYEEEGTLYDNSDEELASVYVLLREYEGSIKDVVIYLFK